MPTELIEHQLWWNGPPWLQLAPHDWPTRSNVPADRVPEEECEVSLMTTVQTKRPIIPLDRYSSFATLQRVTAWVIRFVRNCRALSLESVESNNLPSLTVSELLNAERYWISLSQEHFLSEISLLKAKQQVHKDSCLLPFRPFLDKVGLLRVGGCESNSKFSYSKVHPIIMHGKHPITKLIVHSEHLRLLHAATDLVTQSSLSHHLPLKDSEICHSSVCDLSTPHHQTTQSDAWSVTN